MKKLLFSALLALCVVGATAQKASDAHKASKNVAQNIATSSTPTLSANCRYTQLNITNWDKNAIDVKADIKVTCSNPKKVQAILDCIEVVVSKQGANGVLVATNIDSKSIETIKNRNENYNYTIKIDINAPIGTTMNVDNKYGNTHVQGTTSSLNAIIKYGNLAVGTIGKPSSVTIKYGNLAIDKATDLDLSIKYGNAKVGQMGNLKILESGYGSHSYGVVGSVTGYIKYDKYTFGTVNGDLSLQECKYTNVDISTLNGSLTIGDLGYGNLKVGALGKSFGSVSVDARYSDVAIGTDAGYAFKLSLRTHYGSISTNLTGVTSELKLNESSSKAIEMVVGSNPTKTIRITNRYGNIRVNQK